MKTLRFTLFLFYRYYSSGRRDSIPYFRSLSSMFFLLLLNAVAITGFLDKEKLLFGNDKIHRMIPFILMYGLCLLILWALVKEKELQESRYEDSKIRRGNWWLISYIIFSMVIMIVSIAT